MKTNFIRKYLLDNKIQYARRKHQRGSINRYMACLPYPPPKQKFQFLSLHCTMYNVHTWHKGLKDWRNKVQKFAKCNVKNPRKWTSVFTVTPYIFHHLTFIDQVVTQIHMDMLQALWIVTVFPLNLVKILLKKWRKFKHFPTFRTKWKVPLKT